MYLFCPKNSAIDFTKTFITQEWLVVESCPTPRWITFLMLSFNIRSHFNYLLFAWSAYKKQKRHFWVRKIFTEERKERGEWEKLFRELSNDDREYYYRYLRISPERTIVSANKKLDWKLLKVTHVTRKYITSNVFSNVLQLSQSISLISDYRQKLKFLDLPELINSEVSLNFAEVTGEIFLKPIEK